MRVRWIDSSRGLAILLVVLYHSGQWASAAGYESAVWSEVNDILATIRLPLFFGISGLLAVKWVGRGWRELASSKIATLAWLYLVWQALTAVLYMVIPNVATPGKSNLSEIFTALATPVRPQGALWFLWALALFFVLTKATQAIPRWVVLPSAAALSTVAISDVIDFGNVGWQGAAANFLFFVFGCSYSSLITKFANRLQSLYAVGFILLWLGFMLLAPSAVDALGLNMVARGLGMAAGIAFGYLLASVTTLRWVGTHTLDYYLPHYLILIALAHLASVAPLPQESSVWLPGAFFVVTLGVCTVLHILARRFELLQAAYILPKWARERLATSGRSAPSERGQ
ncbi:acyltransferase family protein [Rhodococcus sp. KRD162]|nr:acyltransferase family protein [Rhodococcus sp. KRD162]